jgi:hypothetical protein
VRRHVNTGTHTPEWDVPNCKAPLMAGKLSRLLRSNPQHWSCSDVVASVGDAYGPPDDTLRTVLALAVRNGRADVLDAVLEVGAQHLRTRPPQRRGSSGARRARRWG